MNEQLLAYVRDGLAKGINKEALEANLLKAGWQEDMIDQAFAQVAAQGPVATPPAMPESLAAAGSGNGSGLGKNSVIPPGVSGWGWGPFFLTWIWGISHSVWISLLIFVPFVGWIMWVVLGVKGREWAWRAKRWENVEHFNRVQRKWSMWGLIIFGAQLLLGVLFMVLMFSNRGPVGELRIGITKQTLTQNIDVLELYKQQHGRYPQSFVGAQEAGFLVFPTDHYLKPLYYQVSEDGQSYEMRSVGADGEYGTADDIILP